MRRWKIAISLALPAVVILPLTMGTWKLKPGGWHPLSFEERERLTATATYTNDCTRFAPSETETGKAICTVLLSDLRGGGRYEGGDQITWRYVSKNLLLMVTGFVLFFLAAMILPSIGARYWAWLKK